MNKVSLIGRTTKDLEKLVKKVNGKDLDILNFTLAVRKNKDKADFIPCVAYSNIANILYEYVGKGAQLGIIGKIDTYFYEDKNGNRNYTFKVIVQEISLISKKHNEEIDSNSDGLEEFYTDDEFLYLEGEE